ncbi:hypothetical protein ARMGADRAFT_1060032 [Armillaria gallica]|uniref:Uncharacterized protein n=1 Tax=Armillaria gallica TaxID=47427 RepID=A0A2H3EBX8_ARMGA|nr:hypothetical protein ARMGADRAFT_1060032 [Armillaria gallica]
MIFFRHTLDLSRELARDTRWQEEVMRNVKALEEEVDKLDEKYNAAMKRVANQESNIAEHAMKRRRTMSTAPSDSDSVKKRTSVSERVKRNRRHAVFVPPLAADALLPREVPTSSSPVSGHVYFER